MSKTDLMMLPAPADAPDERQFWQKLLRVLPRIPFASDLLAAYYCALDPQTPTRVRAILFGAVAYFVAPLDAIPDIALMLGFSDDAMVIATVITVLGRHIQPAHRQRAQSKLESLRA